MTYARFVYDKHDHYYLGMQGDRKVTSLSIEDDMLAVSREEGLEFVAGGQVGDAFAHPAVIGGARTGGERLAL